MSWIDATPSRTGRETYFFLSYAHSVPLSAAARPDTDYWVTRFFQDLHAAVQRGARRGDALDIGFFDGLVAPGADLKETLTDALSRTHVFVPLYSPNYFSNSWAVGERAAFRSRLGRLRPGEADRHILPVLWIPFPPWDDRREMAEALGPVGGPAEYAENGLRALCKLSAYRRQYDLVLSAIAERIIAVTETAPLHRSRAAPVGAVPVEDRGDPALVVTTLATADGRRWRPFAGRHVLTIADYVAATAQRLGLPTRVVEFAGARDRAPDSPTILLIDAGLGVAAVRDAVVGLPRWVVPLVVAGPGTTADEIGAVLRDAPFPEVRPVRGVDEFERGAPLLVIEARKQFLRHGPIYPQDGPGAPRPSLRPTHLSDQWRRGEDR
ncbi:TIR-like protein FxsC [Micromonospora sp. WMMA1363]|uniref:TIR-like protein FxsC n=1 Tax=Micromonospora sp. WMMA1363 TaxID=3053985 RepID=UPI00259C980D|nr:TIR-like protein FxsC [Micromonospora sp. WMMA1363]MDM4719043.1 TIR-like protein FxsC [Micromonospora sp. WMMA1363]